MGYLRAILVAAVSFCHFQQSTLAFYVVGSAARSPAAGAKSLSHLLGPHASTTSNSTTSTQLFMANDEKYQNKVAEILSNFMSKGDKKDPLEDIDFKAPKLNKKLPLDELAETLDRELIGSEWFVTGKVNPKYFADTFKFQDPDVAVEGIEEYARGVCKIFDQETSRAEIISTVANPSVPNTITCTWRLSGRVNIGPGLTIKPYICYTDFTVDPGTGLIVFQEDRFDIPGWDILLSAFFPFLIGIVTSKPADPVEPRRVN